MRTIPIKKATIDLDGDYAGWQATVRTNPPVRVFTELASGELDRIIEGLSSVVLDWNFVDEGGNPLPVSKESFLSLPIDLITMVAEKFSQEMTKIPPR